jgi:hypothetical protein
MLETLTFVIKLVVDPQEIQTWSKDLESFLTQNLAEISNMTNGKVVEILSAKPGRVIVTGYECALISAVTVTARVFLPKIGAVFVVTLEKDHGTFSIYRMPNSIVWVEGPHIGESPNISVVATKIRFENGQFCLVAHRFSNK